MARQEIEPEEVPLFRDHVGRLMVPGVRVSVDVIVAAFNRGESPEAIRDDYGVYLEYVYGIIAYYLHRRPYVEAHLREQEREGAQLRARIESLCPPEEHRAKLLAAERRPATVRLMADDNVASNMLVGLSRIVDAVDVVRIDNRVNWDVDDRGMLERAAEAGRVLVTHDVRNIPDCAYERVRQGLAMPGVFVLSTMEDIETAVRELAAAIRVREPNAWANEVVYLPTRRAPAWFQRCQEITFADENSFVMNCQSINEHGEVVDGPA